MMLTARMCRRRNVTERVAQPNPRVMQDERDAEAQRVREPEQAGPDADRRSSTTSPGSRARVGPMQGVQPMPSARPSSGAPIEAEVAAHLRVERCAARSRTTPMKTRPSRMMTTPITRVMTSAYSRKNRPTRAAEDVDAS